MEGVHRPVYRTLREWWLEHQHVAPEVLPQKTESFTHLQRNKIGGYQPASVNNKDRRITYKDNQNRQSRDLCIIVIECPSMPRTPHCHSAASLKNVIAFNTNAVEARNLITASGSDELDMENTMLAEPTPCHRVCLNDSYKTLRCQLVREHLIIYSNSHRKLLILGKPTKEQERTASSNQQLSSLPSWRLAAS